MNLSKRQKWLLGGAVCAAGGWAADRWLLPDPASAAAAQQPVERGPVPNAVGTSAADASFNLPPPATPLSEVQRSASDVFDWQRLALRVEQPQQVPSGSESRLSGPSFAAQYALRATVLGPEPVALVGQRKMHRGDSLGGYVLKEILADAAVFQSESGDRAVLHVSRARQ